MSTSFWKCCACGEQNHETDGECQFCECDGKSCRRDNCSDSRHGRPRNQEVTLAALRLGEVVTASIPHCGIPSGTVYAALMYSITLDQYQMLIAGLKDVDAVREDKFNYLTRGPKYELALKNMRHSIAEMSELLAELGKV